VFCCLPPLHILSQNKHAVALRDRYPISPGHTLVVPRRHVESVFLLGDAEFCDLGSLVREVRRRLFVEMDPGGFTVGINDGAAAGQTVGHAHVHVIPRFSGDVADPRGGIRWVVPARARYWGEEG
jgi:diadenosine tetraphosphate (Ap4A) HIT family hydrolase